MKRQLTKIVGTSAIALSIALPFTAPASAQNSTDNGTATPSTTTTDTTTYGERDNDFDWGWLGLLGLAGLAGLAGRKRHEEPTRYRDPNTVGSTTYKE